MAGLLQRRPGEEGGLRGQRPATRSPPPSPSRRSTWARRPPARSLPQSAAAATASSSPSSPSSSRAARPSPSSCSPTSPTPTTPPAPPPPSAPRPPPPRARPSGSASPAKSTKDKEKEKEKEKNGEQGEAGDKGDKDEGADKGTGQGDSSGNGADAPAPGTGDKDGDSGGSSSSGGGGGGGGSGPTEDPDGDAKPPSGAHRYRNGENAKCLAAPFNSPPTTADCNGSGTVWAFRPLSDGSFEIVHESGRSCLSSGAGGILLLSCNQDESRRWRTASGGTLKSVGTGGCLGHRQRLPHHHHPLHRQPRPTLDSALRTP
ncbi:ricin-type beta-trefoil lectin domain protein [Actinomadura keratinilytica]